MQVIETHDPDVIRVDDNNIFCRLSGFAVIVVAAAIWPIYLYASEIPDESTSSWGTILLLIVSLFAATVGMFMLLYESQTLIDRRLGKVVQWNRLFFWMPKTEYDLFDFSTIQIRKTTGRYPEWAVDLRGDASEILLYLSPSHTETTQFAEMLSEFTKLAINE